MKALREFLPSGAGVGNPIDMIASAPAEHFRRTLELVAADENVDSLIAIFTPPLVTRAEDGARELVNGIKENNISKPVITAFLSADAAPHILREANVPSYRYPETAAIALARAARYGRWRERPENTLANFSDVRQDEA